MLGECLLMSSLPGKALRTLVESEALPSIPACIIKAEPGKLDIKRCVLGNLVFYLLVYPLVDSSSWGLRSNYRFSVDSTSSRSFKKCNVMLT